MKKSLIIGIFMLMSMCASAQMVAVKTDAVKDLAMIPNLGVDLVVGAKHTLGLQLFGTGNCWGNKVETIGVSPRFRYWISGRPFTQVFLGVNAQVANYNIEWSSWRYQGNSVAAGLEVGYAFNLSQRFNIELSGGTDLMFFNHKEYRVGDNYFNYGEKANANGSIFCPRLEVSFVYVIR